MPTLREIQASFAAALLDDGDPPAAVAADVAPDGLGPAARIAIYRHHVRTSLAAALRAAFPVVCRLVDERFFAYAADRFVRRHPPDGPCLFEYGARFPEFLERFPPCAPHPYLADVARLEWAMHAAFHAPDASPLAPSALAGIPPEDVGRLVLSLDPSAAWLRSAWPVDRIWRANQPDADPDESVRLDAGGVVLEVRRRGDGVGFAALDPATHAFRAALAGGAPLEPAAEAALEREAAFDLTGAIRALFAEALPVGFTLSPAQGEDSR